MEELIIKKIVQLLTMFLFCFRVIEKIIKNHSTRHFLKYLRKRWDWQILCGTDRNFHSASPMTDRKF